MAKMVKADLTGSFGYRLPGGERKYYGPGEGIEIPEGLARTLGVPWQEIVPEGAKEEPAESVPEEADELAGLTDKPGNPAGTPLPDSFPGRRYLLEAGLSTYEALAGLTQDDLVALKGIGEATAEAILLNLPKEGEATGEERTGVPGSEPVED